MPSGERIEAITLTNASGMSVTVTTYGATLLSVKTPSRSSAMAEELTLCHTNLDALRTHSPYYGATVGRVGNRTAKGAYKVDGVAYSGAVNNGPNHLHGGLVGFDKRVWAPRVAVTPTTALVEFSYVSADGEEGYPGELRCTSSYTLTSANELKMELVATTDKPTPVALTNHTYWNLTGGCRSSVLDHELQLHCPLYTPTDATQVPTGEFAPVEGTHFDFTKPTRVGARIAGVDGGGAVGYDHNFVRALPLPATGLALGTAPLAVLHDPASGRTMKVDTNACGVQVRGWVGVRPPLLVHWCFLGRRWSPSPTFVPSSLPSVVHG